MTRKYKHQHKKRPLIVAVDFDGVIHPYVSGYKGPGDFQPPYDGAKEALAALQGLGYDILINTCRGEAKLIEDYLNGHNIPFNWVNDYGDADTDKPDGFIPNPKKVFADIYIDDRAIRFQGWDSLVEEVEDFTLWYDRKGSRYRHGGRVGYGAQHSTPLDLVASHLKHTTARYVALEAEKAELLEDTSQSKKIKEVNNIISSLVKMLECN